MSIIAYKNKRHEPVMYDLIGDTQKALVVNEIVWEIGEAFIQNVANKNRLTLCADIFTARILDLMEKNDA